MRDQPRSGAVRQFAGLVGAAAPGVAAAYVAVTVAEAVVPVLLAWLTKLLLDRLAGTGPITAYVVGLAALGVIAASLPRISLFLSNEASRRLSAVATERLFAATGRLVGLRRFEDPAYLDRLRVARRGCDNAGQLLDGVLGLGRGVLLLAGFIGSLLVLSPAMTVVLVCAAVPMLVAELYLARRRAAAQIGVEPNHRREYFYSQLLTGTQAAKEIRLFGTGGFLRTLMMRERSTADTAIRRMERREVGGHTGLAALTAVVAGAGLIWAALAARRGELSLGDVSIFLAAIASTQSGLAMVVATTANLHAQGMFFAAYAEILRTPPDLPVPPVPVPVPSLRQGIRLRDVWFRYDESHPWVLRGVDLLLPAGSTVALVGLNGSGKSTLVKLLCRLYDPSQGTIGWDGVDLRDADPAQLRTRIGAVFQDFMTYDVSAADNIALGDLTARDDPGRVEAAAAGAGVHSVLRELPRGYQTMLTRAFFDGDDEAGTVLSGGQWQRVAVARGLLREGCDLMILDEPSSGLDPQAEHELHRSLRTARLGRTNLLISHRLSAVRDADLIYVLRDGRVAETGDHSSLLALDGEYARLFRLQAAGYAQEVGS
ncbi:ATP-binding cassette subfamily B protein [Hamadaea flava]|uniref:ABC transporter ATP-binding protein n=1 Tax=Hamadaea flava TaxID=1742688 RepID=A0ABV8LYX5_9ACTN|nr:ABC transporter ATP-binding protein [Hamadaea flava]MCP2322044.1 ATP-binding cassette subfamily B protein [Hamadaea flava]